MCGGGGRVFGAVAKTLLGTPMSQSEFLGLNHNSAADSSTLGAVTNPVVGTLLPM